MQFLLNVVETKDRLNRQVNKGKTMPEMEYGHSIFTAFLVDFEVFHVEFRSTAYLPAEIMAKWKAHSMHFIAMLHQRNVLRFGCAEANLVHICGLDCTEVIQYDKHEQYICALYFIAKACRIHNTNRSHTHEKCGFLSLSLSSSTKFR